MTENLIEKAPEIREGPSKKKTACRECDLWGHGEGESPDHGTPRDGNYEIRRSAQADEFKPTMAEYLKLVQLEKEFEEEEMKEIKVTWVEPTPNQDREITYDPLPSQQKFHDLDSGFKGFSGPIGSGKSQALCQEAIRLSYLNPGGWGCSGRRRIRCCGMRRRRRCSRSWTATTFRTS